MANNSENNPDKQDRILEVLTELQQEVRGLSEKVEGLTKGQDQLSNKVESLTKGQEQLNERQDQLNERQDQLKEGQDKLNKRFEKLSEDYYALRERVDILTRESEQRHLASKSEFERLNTSIWELHSIQAQKIDQIYEDLTKFRDNLLTTMDVVKRDYDFFKEEKIMLGLGQDRMKSDVDLLETAFDRHDKLLSELDKRLSRLEAAQA